MTTIAATFIIAISFLIQSVFGFGGGLIAVPLLSLIIDVKLAVSLVMVFQLFTGVLLIGVWKEVSWREVWKLLPALTLGAIIGVILLDISSLRALQILLALYLIAYVLSQNLRHRQMLWTPTPRARFIAGASSGALQGLFGTGGPMLVTYLRDVCTSTETFRSTIIATLFVSNLIRLSISLPRGLLSSDLWKIALPTLPFFFLALLIGRRFSQSATSRQFDLGVQILLLFSAIALIVH